MTGFIKNEYFKELRETMNINRFIIDNEYNLQRVFHQGIEPAFCRKKLLYGSILMFENVKELNVSLFCYSGRVRSPKTRILCRLITLERVQTHHMCE